MDEKFIVYCETCGKPFDLNAENPQIMPCEVCCNGFCADCFIKAHGKENLDNMLSHGNYWACPECFPLYKSEIFAHTVKPSKA